MITKKQAKALFDTLDDIRTPMMQGDNLAILFCSYFDDGEVNPDSDTGWSEMAENGYSEVIGAIKSHFIPVHQAFIALHERVERLTEALEFYADPSNYRMNGPLDPNSGFFTGGPAETILREATND